MTHPPRQTSTPAQIEAAINPDGAVDPCRLRLANGHWTPTGRLAEWRWEIPPHAVIVALRNQIEEWGHLIVEQRDRIERLEQKVRERR